MAAPSSIPAPLHFVVEPLRHSQYANLHSCPYHSQYISASLFKTASQVAKIGVQVAHLAPAASL